jgi:hypothetical protein
MSDISVNESFIEMNKENLFGGIYQQVYILFIEEGNINLGHTIVVLGNR